MIASRSESFPSVAETSVRSICSNSTGRAPSAGRARVLGLADVADPCDLGAAARDAVGVVVPVDRRRRLDLAVEDDREALERLLLRYALVRDLLPARGQLASDLVELVAAAVGELHQDDGALALPEVLARAVELEVGAGHLGTGFSRSAGSNFIR